MYIEFAYNNSVNTVTGFSPFVLLFAQSPREPWDLFNATGPDEIHRGNSDLDSSLGLDIIINITSARDVLQKIHRIFVFIMRDLVNLILTRSVMQYFFPQKN